METRNIESALKGLGIGNGHNFNDLQILAKEQKITISELVKKHYKKMALECHPDKPTGSHQKMQDLQANYEFIIKEMSDKNNKNSFTGWEEEKNNEWSEMLRKYSESRKISPEKIYMTDFLPGTVEIREENSSDKNISFFMNTFNNMSIAIYYYYNLNTKSIAPVVFYSAIVQAILYATNSTHLMLLNTKNYSDNQSNDKFLVGSFIDKDKQTDAFGITKISIDALKELVEKLSLSWISCGNKISVDEPAMGIQGWSNLTIGGHIRSKSVKEFLGLTLIENQKSTSPLLLQSSGDKNYAIEELLHDGKQAESLTKDLLAEKIKNLSVEDKIKAIGEAFKYIQDNSATKYNYEKPFFSFFENSGADIKNLHISILKNALLEVICGHKNPQELKELIESDNVKKLIDFCRGSSIGIFDSETSTRKEIDALMSKSTLLLEYK